MCVCVCVCGVCVCMFVWPLRDAKDRVPASDGLTILTAHSLPDAMREICNGWKSDNAVASVVRSASIGRLCSSLMGWKEGARLAQDSVLWKPPQVRHDRIPLTQGAPSKLRLYCVVQVLSHACPHDQRGWAQEDFVTRRS